MTGELDPRDFVSHVLSNPNNRTILERWDSLALADGWLVAGCLFQAVWNLKMQRAAQANIKDYDLFYFDAGDLGAEGEAAVQARVTDALADLGIVAEAKNQARVHLWYESYFGHPYPRLADSRAGIDRFLVLATCVGIRPRANGYEVYAPYGLAAMYEGVLAPNPLTDHRLLFEAKARSYRERWPWLRIESGTASTDR
jgi:hypothetical protein